MDSNSSPSTTPGGVAIAHPIAPQIAPRTELLLLALILALGAMLRFTHMGMLEFQADQAVASQMALNFYQHGTMASAGLMSSVGVTNPPLFIYLLIPLFGISSNPMVISALIAALGLLAVAAVWHVGRKYHGSIAGLTAALFFAVSPWAVLYSRNIWAQDFVPIFATATLWAIHSLIFAPRPKAIFWVVLLPLCTAQIHFAGLALCTAVVLILLLLRPRIDLRFAAAGLLLALLTLAPYLNYQFDNQWADFHHAASTLAGGQPWDRLRGLTVSPATGYRLPIHASPDYALSILNSGHIEDTLGIAADPVFDPTHRWPAKSNPPRAYFSQSLTLPSLPLIAERVAVVLALLWLAAVAIRTARPTSISAPQTQRTCVLLLWLIVPLLVFFITGLWTYLTYYVILYPAHFLVLGIATERISANNAWRFPIAATILAIAAANVIFMLDLYRFTETYGGAQGTFGSVLVYKQAAARFIAEQGGPPLQEECQRQLALATRREPRQVTKPLNPQLRQLDHQGAIDLPELEYPYLITQATPGTATLPPTVMILIVDTNREAFSPDIWQKLATVPHQDFGPIRLYFLQK